MEKDGAWRGNSWEVDRSGRRQVVQKVMKRNEITSQIIAVLAGCGERKKRMNGNVKNSSERYNQLDRTSVADDPPARLKQSTIPLIIRIKHLTANIYLDHLTPYP